MSIKRFVIEPPIHRAQPGDVLPRRAKFSASRDLALVVLALATVIVFALAIVGALTVMNYFFGSPIH